MRILNNYTTLYIILQTKSLAYLEEYSMKKDIHPKVYHATFECACGFTDTLESTRGEHVHVEICSHCHPFYTGKQRLIDTEGRVDRFRKKYAQFQKS